MILSLEINKYLLNHENIDLVEGNTERLDGKISY